jgi:hypothetical protein
MKFRAEIDVEIEADSIETADRLAEEAAATIFRANNSGTIVSGTVAAVAPRRES